mgnify:FL=1
MNANSPFFKTVLIVQLIVLSLSVSGQTPQIDTTAHIKIQQQTEHIFDSLVKIRRDFHMYPELSEQEERTSKKIAEYLKALGLDVYTNIGGYGVVGVLETHKKGKRIAWRADIDALASNHPEDVDFSSKNEGVRHICGHDVHTTIALGIANVLTHLKDSLTGTVYFIFQPSEENLAGAKAMITDGLFDIINPDEIYALHIAPMPEGIITTKARNLYADYKGIELTFKNTKENSAVINYTKNLLLSFQNVAPDSKFWDNRNLLDPNIGLGNPNTIFKNYITVNPNISSKETKNKLSIKAYLSAEKETQLDSIFLKIRSEIKKSEYSNQLVDISFYNETALVLNNTQLTSKATSAIRKVYGSNKVLPLYGAIPDGRSDDFSFFQQQIPGVYFLLGGSNFEKGIVSMPHTPSFAIDENSIKTGIECFSSMILERLKP